MPLRLPPAVHRLAVASLGMLAAATLLPAVASAATAPSGEGSGGQVAADAFTRVGGGLGTADVGGAWSTSGNAGEWSTSGGVGRLALPTPGRGGIAYLPATSTDTDLSATVSLAKAATGGGTYVSMLGRRVAGQGQYQLDLKLSSDQSMRLSLSRTFGTQTTLSTAVRAVKQYAAGAPLHVRLRVRGTGTTTLLGKAWVGNTEPSAWSVRATDSTKQLQAPGTPGFSGYLSGSATKPQAMTIDDLSVTTPTTTLTGPADAGYSTSPRSSTSSTSSTGSRSAVSPTVSNRRTQSFSFTANTPGSTFQCRLEAAAWAPCSNPTSFSGLSDGSHAFAVRALDADGFAAPAATYLWLVDTTPPTVTISGGPADATNSKDASFALSSSELAVFECQLDGASWLPCSTSPQWTDLAEGNHDLAVRATDTAANTGPVAHRTWTIDTTPPTVTISGGPANLTNTKDAEFGLSSAEAASFECQLDSASWQPCSTSPKWTGLADGNHDLAVRATDTAANTGPVQHRTWTIDTAPPSVTISGGPTGHTSAKDAAFSLTSTEAASFECQLDGASWLPCTASPRWTGLGDGNHDLAVRATDLAGNTGPVQHRTWTIDATPAPSPGTSVLRAAGFDNVTQGAMSPADFQKYVGGTDKSTATYDDTSIVADPRGGNAMRVKLDANTIRTNPGGNNGIVVIGALSKQVDNACMSYDVKFDANFDWSKGGKLPGLLGVAPGVPPSKPAGGHPAGDQGWSGRLMWFGPKTFKSNGRTNTVVNYMYSPNQKTEYGDDIGWNAGFTQGKWHNVKQCYTMNTVGQANGIIRGYLDGKQVLNQTDYVFRTRPDVHISHVAWSVFRGGATMDWASPQADTIDFDNLNITTQ